MCLGSAVFVDETASKVSHFHVGPSGSPPVWEDRLINRTLWKMLADHQGHAIHTFFDYEFDVLADRATYVEIGGDFADITYEEYLNIPESERGS